MKVLVARIKHGEIKIEGEVISSVDKALAVFVGIERGDIAERLNTMADKVINLRIFEDQDGKLAYSVKDKDFSILCIPNFTLCATTSKGRRPSFEGSMKYNEAEKFFDEFVMTLKSYGVRVQEGVFGAYMDISLDIDGPVNIILEEN